MSYPKFHERRLVVAFNFGSDRAYVNFSLKTIQAYAKRCNADFLVLHDQNPKYDCISYHKWEYVKYLSLYDRIMHVDADIMIRSTTPDLFELVPIHCFGAVDEYPYQNLSVEIPSIDRMEDMKRLGPTKDSPFYLNNGLYLFSRHHEILFSTPVPNNPCQWKDQSHINYSLNVMNSFVYLLHPTFNFMKLMENTGLSKDDAHIIHYAGNWGGLTDLQVRDMMIKDYS